MDLRAVDLNLLVSLDALLSERSVTRAAARMCVGQPAMSASLSRLRKLFDDPLFVRAGRTLELTPLAQSLIVPTRSILAETEALLKRRPTFDPTVDARTFTVVASDYMTLVLIRPLLAQLHAAAPRVRVTVQPVSRRMHEQLDRGEADLVLLPIELDPAMRGYHHRRLFTDRYVCVVSRDHPDVAEHMTLELLTSLPYLACEPTSFPYYVEVQLDELGISPNVEVATTSFVLAPLLLRGTRLVAILHQRLAREVGARADLRILEAPVPLRPITETMFWHSRTDDEPAHRWLRDHIAAVASTL